MFFDATQLYLLLYARSIQRDARAEKSVERPQVFHGVRTVNGSRTRARRVSTHCLADRVSGRLGSHLYTLATYADTRLQRGMITSSLLLL